MRVNMSLSACPGWADKPYSFPIDQVAHEVSHSPLEPPHLHTSGHIQLQYSL